MSRAWVQPKHWTVAAFFVSLLLLVGAPASAHPGHHGPHHAVHSHTPDAVLLAEASHEELTAPPALAWQTSLPSFSSPQILPREPVVASTFIGAESLLPSACHGTCCFGMSCCVAFIGVQASSLIHPHVPHMRVTYADQAIPGFEPDSLLEPPNTRA